MRRAPNDALQLMVSMAEGMHINTPEGGSRLHLTKPFQSEDGSYVCEIHLGAPNSNTCLQVALCDLSYSGYFAAAIAGSAPMAQELLELRARVGELEDMLQGAIVMRPLVNEPTP